MARDILEKLRAAIIQELARFGVNSDAPLSETLLIRDGVFCGRKFVSAGFQVVWFMEENQIKFYSPVGQLIASTTVESCLAESQPTISILEAKPAEIRRAA